MTCSGGRSGSRPADDAGDADEPDGDDEPTTAPTEGHDPGLIEHVADAVGDLWDDPPDEP